MVIVVPRRCPRLPLLAAVPVLAAAVLAAGLCDTARPVAGFRAGAQHVIDSAIDSGVRKVIALSIDKASSPVNLYGASKLCSDKLFVAGNHYAASGPTRFAMVRYGNVIGSRGSVVPLFRRLAETARSP